jgi:hypothetical protein
VWSFAATWQLLNLWTVEKLLLGVFYEKGDGVGSLVDWGRGNESG